MDLEIEAKNWMKERQLSDITAAEYQARACQTAIFPKHCAVLAEELEMNLGHIMEKNLEKLADRHKRGKISGSGDNR